MKEEKKNLPREKYPRVSLATLDSNLRIDIAQLVVAGTAKERLAIDLDSRWQDRREHFIETLGAEYNRFSYWKRNFMGTEKNKVGLVPARVIARHDCTITKTMKSTLPPRLHLYQVNRLGAAAGALRAAKKPTAKMIIRPEEIDFYIPTFPITPIEAYFS